MSERITVETHAKTEVVNVTEQVAALVRDVNDGIVLFYTPHTTAALIVNEDDDELREDIARVAANLMVNLRPFKHARKGNPNAEAHIFSALAGNTLMFAVEEGRLDLGTWQNILFVELDGPKQREIRCKIIRR